MAVNSTFTNILELLGSLYPTFLVFFLVVAALFNFNILKAITYLGGIVLCFVSWYLTGKLFDTPRGSNASLTCNLFSIPGTNYMLPALPIIISFFTFSYLLIPMLETNTINPVVLAFLIIFSGINIYYQLFNFCTNAMGVALSIIMGLILGGIWFGIFMASGQRNLLFYSELNSNNVICERPSKQTFRCSVYKNGRLISNNIV